jgi:hypothetical protein
MRIVTLTIFVLGSILLRAQTGLPAWLEPDSLGKDMYMQGMVSLKGDTTKTSCKVTVIRTGADSAVFNFTVGNDGFYEFFLKPDQFYHIIFKKEGFASKKLDVYTTGIPEKAWKRGFAIVVDVEMEQVPPQFDRSLFDVPVGICKYFEKEKKLMFDQDYTNAMRQKWDSEIELKQE